MSGSTDGLICAFDISQTEEDDALLCTLNTDSSVGNINWHENPMGKDLVSCITHTNDLQLFNAEDFDEAELLKSFDRESVTQHIKVKSISMLVDNLLFHQSIRLRFDSQRYLSFYRENRSWIAL